MYSKPSSMIAVVGLLGGLTVASPAQSTDSATAATIAAVSWLLEADSLEAVAWPSPKTLLARRPGQILITGTTTRFREDPAKANALAERLAEALAARGITVRTSSSTAARSFCGRGNSPTCTLPDSVGLVVMVGYGNNSTPDHAASVMIVTDSRLRSGRPVISLDIHLDENYGAWRVTSVRRTAGSGN